MKINWSIISKNKSRATAKKIDDDGRLAAFGCHTKGL